MPLFILDRDGVINEDSGDYIKSVAEWRPIPGSIEAIARLCDAGYSVVVATNQSGINRGLFSLAELDAMHCKLRELVEAAGGQIAGIYHCPHRPDENCRCRKPNTGLLDKIIEDWGNIEGVAFVGDSLKDLQLSEKMNCHTILVRTGKGLNTEQQLKESRLDLARIDIYNDLASVVASVLAGSTTG